MPIPPALPSSNLGCTCQSRVAASEIIRGRRFGSRELCHDDPPSHASPLSRGTENAGWQSGSADDACIEDDGLRWQSFRCVWDSRAVRSSKGTCGTVSSSLRVPNATCTIPPGFCVPDTCQPRTSSRSLTQTESTSRETRLRPT